MYLCKFYLFFRFNDSNSYLFVFLSLGMTKLTSQHLPIKSSSTNRNNNKFPGFFFCLVPIVVAAVCICLYFAVCQADECVFAQFSKQWI